MASSTKKNEDKDEQLIKSKERVRDLAEVYTRKKEVNAMLDLIPDFSVAQTYLEPACGNGNFLIEILRRKLKANPVTRAYYERDGDDRMAHFPKGGKAEGIFLEAIQAVSTIYGFDICPNNTDETKVRLYAYLLYGEDLLLPGFLTGNDFHTQAYIEAVTPDHKLPLASNYEANLYRFAENTAKYKKLDERAATISPLLKSVLRLVLSRNFQQGDYLSQQDLNGQPLTVGKWTFLFGKVRREDFLLADVGAPNPKPISTLTLRSLANFVKGGGHA